MCENRNWKVLVSIFVQQTGHLLPLAVHLYLVVLSVCIQMWVSIDISAIEINSFDL